MHGHLGEPFGRTRVGDPFLTIQAICGICGNCPYWQSAVLHDFRDSWSNLIGPDWTSTNVAQLRYDERSDRWTLYAADRNSRWFPYDDVGLSRDVGPLLAEIDEDPTAIFWG